MNRLKELKVEEVSLVSSGANSGAKVTFFKRRGVAARLEELVAKMVSGCVREAEYEKVAKRYEILGTPAKELAPLLKAAAEQNPEIYESAIRSLEIALKALTQSGVFEEVGKSGVGKSNGRIEAYAAELRKNDPSLSYRWSIEKAYQRYSEQY